VRVGQDVTKSVEVDDLWSSTGCWIAASAQYLWYPAREVLQPKSRTRA